MDPVSISAIISLIVQAGAAGMALWVRLEPLLNLGPDEKANIAKGVAAANEADNATISAATIWLVSNGYKPTFTKNVGG